jgi:general secretion pathway protein A
MYAPFFGLRQEPFSIAPDPRFLYLSTMHREALAHLLFGLGAGGGFVLLTGEIGAGKTTVCRCFLEQVPAQHHVAYIFNPRLTVAELLQTICQEFGLTVTAGSGGGTKPMIDALNGFMLAAHAEGRNCVLIIDEAQALDGDVLEQLRLLTNLETHERKLLQIILIGQPELRDLLATPAMEQLAQRIVARYHLGPLSADETGDYIRHRLAVAGQGGPLPFDAGALGRVHRLTGGVPRRINLLCDRALLGAYAKGATKVDWRTVRQAAREVFGSDDAEPRTPAAAWFGVALATAGIAAAVAAGTLLWQGGPPRPMAMSASAPDVRASAALAQAPVPASGPVQVELAQATVAEEAQAWPLLAQAWTLDWPPTADACEQARRLGLACHRGSGDLAALRQLDRPVILSLNASDGRPARHAVLQALDPQTATLSTASGPRKVAIEVLVSAWSGDFMTLWRPPAGYQEPMIDRANGPGGEWLLTQLAQLQGDAPALKSLASDEALRRRVFAFQLQRGLRGDGLAGPLTLMHLNRAAGVDEPRLGASR